MPWSMVPILQEPVDTHYPGDDLLTPLARRRGLPIGNLTSQFFANVYLDGLDHFATEVLRAPYVRYVDDFALFHDDPEILAEWRMRIADYLARRRLSLHPRKTAMLPTAAPSIFLGFVLFPAAAACPRRMCGGSATGCAASAIAIATGRLILKRPCCISAPGSRMRPMRIHGGYARRSSATRYLTRRGGLAGPHPRRSRRLLEQQPTERSRGESQQQRTGQPKQQYRVPSGQDTSTPEPASPRRSRVCRGVSRTGHDEWLPSGSGRGVRLGRQRRRAPSFLSAL
jgi:hypothetical protein